MIHLPEGITKSNFRIDEEMHVVVEQYILRKEIHNTLLRIHDGPPWAVHGRSRRNGATEHTSEPAALTQ